MAYIIYYKMTKQMNIKLVNEWEAKYKKGINKNSQKSSIALHYTTPNAINIMPEIAYRLIKSK